MAQRKRFGIGIFIVIFIFFITAFGQGFKTNVDNEIEYEKLDKGDSIFEYFVGKEETPDIIFVGRNKHGKIEVVRKIYIVGK
ncbi:MAG: hypothetical protein UEP31_05640 [Anaerovoracaceae bacterium]|nr:hypothetical protein [Anaerovoracaceae bacterium]